MKLAAEHIEDAYTVAIQQQVVGTEPAIVEVAYIIAAHAPKQLDAEKLQRYISTDLGEVCLADNVTELEAVNDVLWQAIKALTTNHEAAHAPKETNIKPDTAQADAVISELEAELLKFKQAFGEALLEIAGLKAREKP